MNIGISGSINIPLFGPVGVHATGFAGVAYDGSNLAGYAGAGGGAGVGAGVTAGVQMGGSNAKSVCDLAGPFLSVGGSGGEGVVVGGEGYAGKGSDGGTISGGNIFIGVGGGTPISGGAGGTYTWVH